MALSDITRDGVLQAIEEYNALTERGFFDKYGFEAATKYWILYDGKAYASKAIANVAQAIGMKRPYARDIRKGGGHAIVRRLRDLGFTVPESREERTGVRADTWTREELILALDLYQSSPRSPPSKKSNEVAELTKILGKLAVLRGAAVGPKFRNENGVYMKMMNFRRFDPVFLSQGKRGMERGGRLEEEVWKAYSGDPAALRAAAALIRAAANDPKILVELQTIGTEDADGVEEGAVSYRMHKRYERDRSIVEKKKASTLSAHGYLRCECCTFDFAAAYGELGFGYIEAHHRKPVFQMQPGERTRPEDLALVCSNCHRMIHSRKEPLTIDEVRSRLVSREAVLRGRS